jgi:hypothetical protein
MNNQSSENLRISEDQFLASLMNKRCAGTLLSGERFGGLLLSYDGDSLIVRGGRGGDVLVRRAAIANIYALGV